MSALRSISREIPGNEQELRRFLCSRYWLPAADFPLCGDVFSALGLSGDDCHDFMENFAVIFNVDLSDYVWPRFHLSESEAQDVRAVLRPLMRMAGLKTQPLNRDLVPISIDHLLHVAEAGRWLEPTALTGDGDGRVSVGRSISRFGSRLRAGGVPRRPNR